MQSLLFHYSCFVYFLSIHTPSPPLTQQQSAWLLSKQNKYFKNCSLEGKKQGKCRTISPPPWWPVAQDMSRCAKTTSVLIARTSWGGWPGGWWGGWWGGCLVPHHRTVTQVIRMPIGVTIPCQTGPIVAGLTRARHVFCPNLNGLSDCLTCPYCACALSIKLEHS